MFQISECCRCSELWRFKHKISLKKNRKTAVCIPDKYEFSGFNSIKLHSEINLSKEIVEKAAILGQVIPQCHFIVRTLKFGGGRVVRRCWVNFQCQGVPLTWLTVGQGPIVLSVGAGGGCLDIFSSPDPKAPGELIV